MVSIGAWVSGHGYSMPTLDRLVHPAQGRSSLSYVAAFERWMVRNFTGNCPTRGSAAWDEAAGSVGVWRSKMSKHT